MASSDPSSQKFKMDTSKVGGVGFAELHGILAESFEGRSLAEKLTAKKIVVSLRDVRRFASWGMAEWMNFLRATTDRDLYFVECSTYALNQMNLVTGLLGHGKLVSFYMPYRCGSCGEEFELLTLAPSERAKLRSLTTSEQSCTTCGGVARIDKATMYSALAERPAFDLDDEVIQFLRKRFGYDLATDLTRFRAARLTTKGATYLRLSGKLTTLPAEQLVKTVEGAAIVDLAAATYDPDELGAWRAFVQTAVPLVTSLQLLDCPAGFLETAIAPGDLGEKLAIRSFAHEYPCAACRTTTVRMIDVSSTLEHLIEGVLPTTECPTCKALLSTPASPALAAVITRLPAREHDAALDRFIAKARAENATKLEDALAVRAKPPAAAGATRAVWIAAALALVVVGGGIAFAVTKWNQPAAQQPAAAVVPQPAPTPPPPKFQRPDWIISDVPSSAFCQDMINRLVCVGVSSYRPTRDAAAAEANDAALEELANSVALKIEDPTFKSNVLPAYSAARTKAITALQAADTDRASAAYASADDVVRKARTRVVEILRSIGGSAVPAQRSDWYWEEYAKEKGSGTEALVFVRYDVSLDAVKALVERLTATTSALGGVFATAYPGLAWELDDFHGGLQIRKSGPQLQRAGLGPGTLVTSVNGQPVIDAVTLEGQLAKASGPIALGVRKGADTKTVELGR
jgi:DNA-directed RNA polymerase subunit RPC12/RpoP